MKESPNIVKVKFHGNLGKRLKKKTWDIAVESVSEAFYAIDIMSKRNLVKCMIEDSEKQLQYQVKVNNKLIDTSEIDPEKLSTIKNSELCIKKKIKTIDIIPLPPTLDIPCVDTQNAPISHHARMTNHACCLFYRRSSSTFS